MGFLDSFLDTMTSNDVLSAAIPSAIGLIGGIMGNKQQDKLAKGQADKERENLLLQLDLEELKAKYGVGAKGGGGGGGGGGTSAAQRAQMYQNAAQINQDSRNSQMSALSKLGDSLAQAYLR
jgi:hypothetical protein